MIIFNTFSFYYRWTQWIYVDRSSCCFCNRDVIRSSLCHRKTCKELREKFQYRGCELQSKFECKRNRWNLGPSCIWRQWHMETNLTPITISINLRFLQPKIEFGSNDAISYSFWILILLWKPMKTYFT